MTERLKKGVKIAIPSDLSSIFKHLTLVSETFKKPLSPPPSGLLPQLPLQLLTASASASASVLQALASEALSSLSRNIKLVVLSILLAESRHSHAPEDFNQNLSGSCLIVSNQAGVILT